MCMVSGRPDSRRRSKKIPDIAKDHVSWDLVAREPALLDLGGRSARLKKAEQLLRQSKVNS